MGRSGKRPISARAPHPPNDGVSPRSSPRVGFQRRSSAASLERQDVSPQRSPQPRRPLQRTNSDHSQGGSRLARSHSNTPEADSDPDSDAEQMARGSYAPSPQTSNQDDGGAASWASPASAGAGAGAGAARGAYSDEDEDDYGSGADRVGDARGEQPTEQEDALSSYAAALQHPRTGIPLGTRRSRLTTYKLCFSGADAAGWFMANLEGTHTQEQATAVGQQLLDLGVIRHVKRGRQFAVSDTELFQFRNANEDKSGSLFQQRRLSRSNSQASIGSLTSIASRNSLSRSKSWGGSRTSINSTRSSVSSASSVDGSDASSHFAGDDDGFKSPLHLAAGRGDIAGIRQLVQDYGVENLDSSGRTPLMYAVIGNKGKACKVLVKCSADINARDDLGNTPLVWAACRGASASLKELLKMGADVSATDNEGRTAMHWATKLKRTDCLDLILRCAYRVVVNKKDEEQLTALHWATMCDHSAHANCLLKAQADPTVGDGSGRTALHYAVLHSAYKCLTLLLEHARHAINIPDASGRTPLHSACGEGTLESVAMLVTVPGIDINAADERMTTPLHWVRRGARRHVPRCAMPAAAQRGVLFDPCCFVKFVFFLVFFFCARAVHQPTPRRAALQWAVQLQWVVQLVSRPQRSLYVAERVRAALSCRLRSPTGPTSARSCWHEGRA